MIFKAMADAIWKPTLGVANVLYAFSNYNQLLTGIADYVVLALVAVLIGWVAGGIIANLIAFGARSMINLQDPAREA